MSPHPVSLSILTVTLALASSAGQALAADPSSSPTRAEVKASVLEARARGQLMPAGEASQPFAVAATPSTLSYREVRNETLMARAQGALVPAGEGSPAIASGGTQMARAEVRESTRMARVNHELVPAGEGIGPVEYQARGPARRLDTVAIARH
jgi:hypothetical protein